MRTTATSPARDVSAAPANGGVVDAIEHVLEREGRVSFRAQGTSMMPALWPGCRVTVARCDARALVPGELALLRHGDRLVLHRVVEVDAAGVVTQGDAHAHTERSGPGQVLGRAGGLAIGRRHFPAFPEHVVRPLRTAYLRGLPFIRWAVQPALRGYLAVRRRPAR